MTMSETNYEMSNTTRESNHNPITSRTSSTSRTSRTSTVSRPRQSSIKSRRGTLGKYLTSIAIDVHYVSNYQSIYIYHLDRYTYIHTDAYPHIIYTYMYV